jgi:hypothetical protein
MSQLPLIIVIALLAGLCAAGATWVAIDVLQVLGDKWVARRERKRLEAEAKAVKAAEEAPQ